MTARPGRTIVIAVHAQAHGTHGADHDLSRLEPRVARQIEAELNELATMLRVNGSQVVSDLAIVAWRPNAAGTYEPETVVEGAEFAARHPTPA